MDPTEPLYLCLLLLTGTFTGLVSGLLGVGGGFIMSPVQYWLLQEAGVSPDLALRIAFGTSLCVIFPNAISGTLKHHRYSSVLWKPAVLMGISGSIASFLGAALAAYLSASILSKIFGVTVILGALKTCTAPVVRTGEKISSNPLVYVAAGLLIGFFSGLVGIGGGVIGIPVMLVLLHFDMKKAIGTSAAVMIFTSFGGMLGYIIHGWNEPGLPLYSLGYVNLLNWLLLAGPGILATKKGAQITSVAKPEYLQKFFVLLMVYVGLKMMGIL